AHWREEAGKSWWWRSLFKVFLLQGAVLWIVSLPVQLTMTVTGAERFTVWDAVGELVWAFGFLYEAIADAQLRSFKTDPGTDGVLDSGLWHNSRHPNYFGEAVLWWGIGFVALSVPWGWLTLSSPLLMTLLLRYASGVPMAERLMEGRPGWDDYARRTPIFVPGPRAPAGPGHRSGPGSESGPGGQSGPGTALIALIALAGLIGTPRPAAAQDGLAIGDTPDGVVLETLDGESVDLGALTGERPVLIEFWATWCAVCRALEPDMNKAYEAHGDAVEFVVVAAAVAQTREGVARHLARHPVPGRVLWDTRGRFTRAFDAPGTGYVVILDAEGRVAYVGTGPNQDLADALADVLGPE
ncbi:MAG: DUF1295 domain-containing protein, partial [Gemmatimonadota bacterium]